MVGIKKVSFIVLLTDEDRYRHNHIRFKNEILSFVVQYEMLLEGVWLPVVRYDTGHGFAHRDLFDRKGNKHKTPVFARDYNEALIFAESDIKSNWSMYKENFLGSTTHEEVT